MKKNILIVIAGPTAVGKTDFSIRLAKHFNTEIISADSRQVFKEMTIGTAKPSQQQLKEVKHHFINSHSITQTMNAGIYEKECLPVIDALFEKHNVVILTGGTGLYMDVIINGIDNLPPADAEVRKRLEEELANTSLELVAERLKNIDGLTFSKIDIKNPKRLLRALEVFEITGKPYSQFLEKKKPHRNFTPILFCLNKEREELYSQINLRVDKMIEDGLEQEVRSLIAFRNHNALQTVGYKEFFDFFDEKLSIEQTVELIKKNTRNYAKRQLTWFRRYEEMNWIEGDEFEKVIESIK